MISLELENVPDLSMEIAETLIEDVSLVPMQKKIGRIVTAQEISEKKRLFVEKYHHKWAQGELLNSLEIYAWDSIEDMILSAVAFPYTNLILVGEAGSGKTNGARKILSALFGGPNVRKVDTAFEDELSLGICDVPDLVAKKMQTFLTDNAIVKFTGVILDEINRSQEAQRKMYYPFLSERIIMGHLCKAMVVIGTMNPLGDVYNTEPLDLAFAERFVKVVNIPEFHRVDESYRLKMLRSVNNSLGLDLEINYPKEIQRPFQAALHATMFAYDEISASLIPALVKYVDSIIIGAQATTPPLKIQSTRTGKNLIRNILRNIAFRKAVYGENPTDILEQVAQKELNHVSTAELYDEPLDKNKLEALHAKAKQYLIVKNAALSLITKITNPCEAICALLAKTGSQITEVDRNRLLQHHLDQINRKFVAIGLTMGVEVGGNTLKNQYKNAGAVADVMIICTDILTGGVDVTDSVLVVAAQMLKDITRRGVRAGSKNKEDNKSRLYTYTYSATMLELTSLLLQMPAGEYTPKGNEIGIILATQSDRLSALEDKTNYFPVSLEQYLAPEDRNLLFLTSTLEEYLTRVQGRVVGNGAEKTIMSKRLFNWNQKKEKYNDISNQQD